MLEWVLDNILPGFFEGFFVCERDLFNGYKLGFMLSRVYSFSGSYVIIS